MRCFVGFGFKIHYNFYVRLFVCLEILKVNVIYIMRWWRIELFFSFAQKCYVLFNYDYKNVNMTCNSIKLNNSILYLFTTLA
jgi:hypothetical protein